MWWSRTGHRRGSRSPSWRERRGAPCRPIPKERGVFGGQLSFLAPLALLTTGADAPIGEARTGRESWLRPLVDEAAAAAGTWSVAVDAGAVAARLRALRGGMQSSMLKDFRSGRSLELDAIAGPIIRALGVVKAATTV